MTVERQFSAGGVVVRQQAGELKVLLIKDRYGRWTWPKGHIEQGESPAEAALREITEETGLQGVEILEEVGRQEYYFSIEGAKIFKAVHIFLARAPVEGELKIQQEEIDDARWFSASSAAETIEYEGSRALLEKAVEAFKKRKEKQAGSP
jgi:8-oxo-dGTP pyrophosphatase MutT (NUDIX family)